MFRQKGFLKFTVVRKDFSLLYTENLLNTKKVKTFVV